MRALLLSVLLLSPGIAAPAQKHGWLGTWTTSNFKMPPGMTATLKQQSHLGSETVTLREIVHLSQGGSRVRVQFSNEFGTTPLTIGAAHVGFLQAGSAVLPGTDRQLLFAGQPSVTIPAGGFVASDAVVERVPIFSDLVISMAVPAQLLPSVTFHNLALQTTFIASGDQTAAAALSSPLLRPPGLSAPDVAAPIQKSNAGDKPIVRTPNRDTTASATIVTPLLAQSESWFFLKDVEVDAGRKSAAVVCLGDSITDGAGSTTETNRRYPDVLEGLAAQQTKTMYLAALNAGIGGNRLLQDGVGPTASARLDRDVLTQAGVRWVILLEGINDIGATHGVGLTVEQLIASYTDIAQRVHAKGVKIYGATLPPFEGAGYYTEAGEQIRQRANAFLRSNSVFDGVIDFDKAVRDPDHPTRLLAKFDRGDHLHPSDQGYAAMGAAVSLKLFQRHK